MGKAKTLEAYQFEHLRKYVREFSQTPERDDLFLLLSFRAGLRAVEISRIDLSAMTDAAGRVASMITIHRTVGKKERSRDIPMHPELADALIRFRRRYPAATYVAVSPIDGRRMSPNAVTVWFWKTMREAGLEGSSHSGRRTFGTKLARRCNTHGGSLRDVQLLLGHSRLETTETYVEPSEAVFSMVASL